MVKILTLYVILDILYILSCVFLSFIKLNFFSKNCPNMKNRDRFTYNL